MRAKLLALAAAVSALGAGALLLVDWDSGTVQLYDGDWQFVNRATCSLSACNQPACVQAANILSDAGSPCVPRFATCDFRINDRLRAAAAANGVTLSAKKYQTLKVGVMRCPADGGGFAFGLPLDNTGWPVVATVAAATSACVRAPRDGGGTCTKDEHDGGSRYFGAGNVFSATDAVGPDCEPVSCSIFFGDSEDDL